MGPFQTPPYATPPIIDPKLAQRYAQTHPGPDLSDTPVAAGAPAQPQPQAIPRAGETSQAPVPVQATSQPTAPPAIPRAGGSTAPLAFPAVGQGRIIPTAGPVDAEAHKAELARLEGSKPGVAQIHNPVLRTLGTIGDVASAFFPRAAPFIPGTTAHHNMLVGNARRAVSGDIAQEEAEARTGLQKAQTAEAQAKAKQGQAPHTLNTAEGIMQFNPETQRFDIPAGQPAPKEEVEGKTVTTDQGIMQWDPKTQRYDISVGNAPGAKGGTVHELTDGTLIMAHQDGTATPITVNGQPAKAPPKGASDTEIIHKQINGKPHNVMVKKGTGEVVADLGELGEKESATEPGTWTFAEDQQGKPVLFNSKTGQTRPAPEGLQPKGTEAKTAPARDALSYANEYMSSNNFTGPGDEALMDQFFQLAKPKRMNANQNKILMESRDLIEGAQARLKHAFTPNSPYFSDEQRKRIVDTMRTLAQSQGMQPGGGAGSAKAPAIGTVENGYRFKGGDPGKQESWERVAK